MSAIISLHPQQCSALTTHVGLFHHIDVSVCPSIICGDTQLSPAQQVVPSQEAWRGVVHLKRSEQTHKPLGQP